MADISVLISAPKKPYWLVSNFNTFGDVPFWSIRNIFSVECAHMYQNVLHFYPLPKLPC